MPTYEYRCEQCGTPIEVVQSFSDAPLTTCESCGGSLRKVFAPVGIVFKGSGFYKTDSRSTSRTKAAGSPEASKPTADASSGTGEAKKGDASNGSTAPEKAEPKKKDAVAAKPAGGGPNA